MSARPGQLTGLTSQWVCGCDNKRICGHLVKADNGCDQHTPIVASVALIHSKFLPSNAQVDKYLLPQKVCHTRASNVRQWDKKSVLTADMGMEVTSFQRVLCTGIGALQRCPIMKGVGVLYGVY